MCDSFFMVTNFEYMNGLIVIVLSLNILRQIVQLLYILRSTYVTSGHIFSTLFNVKVDSKLSLQPYFSRNCSGKIQMIAYLGR